MPATYQMMDATLAALIEKARQAAIADVVPYNDEDAEVMILWDALNRALVLLGYPPVAYDDVYGTGT